MAGHSIAKRRIRDMVLRSNGLQEGPERPTRQSKHWSNLARLALVGLTMLICSGVKAQQQCPGPDCLPTVFDPNLGVPG
jgi:hypothetical protein